MAFSFLSRSCLLIYLHLSLLKTISFRIGTWALGGLGRAWTSLSFLACNWRIVLGRGGTNRNRTGNGNGRKDGRTNRNQTGGCTNCRNGRNGGKGLGMDTVCGTHTVCGNNGGAFAQDKRDQTLDFVVNVVTTGIVHRTLDFQLLLYDPGLYIITQGGPNNQ